MFDIFDMPESDEGNSDFVSHQQLDKSIRLERRAAKREFVAGLRHEALIQLLPTLPPPDTDLWIVSTGDGAQGMAGSKREKSFDFGDLIPHVIGMFGPGCDVFVSTWTANHEHVTRLSGMLKSGEIARLTFLSDPYFQQRTPAIAAALFFALEEYADRARFKLLKNHCKIICIRDASRTRYCSVMGSANLNMQPRAENYTLSTAPEVYDFLTEQFFEAMLRQQARADIKRRNRTKKPPIGNSEEG